MVVFMKLDNIIEWNWNEIFMIYWVFFALLVVVNMGFIIVLLTKC
jgi:hypothetical protein